LSKVKKIVEINKKTGSEINPKPVIYAVFKNVPYKNAKGSNALLPIFVNLKSNTMKKSRYKSTAFFNMLQTFSIKDALKACFITYI